MAKEQINIESEWIRAIRNGNEHSFKSLFNTYCQKLINFSRRYVLDKEIAENIVQDVFVKVWTNRDNLDHTKNIKTYLFTAVKNNSFKYLRHLNVERAYSEITFDTKEDFDPMKNIEKNETVNQIKIEINKLPEKCQEIFSMSKIDKLKYSEIADILNISVKTVETQMGRALKKLRENLKDLIVFFITLIALFFVNCNFVILSVLT